MTSEQNNPELAALFAGLETRLEAERAAARIPGLSIVIVYDQDVIWSSGFGYADLETQTPATPQTIYRVGSVTKLFTATMLMQLRDAGKVCLDEPVERYLPAFRFKSRFDEPGVPTFRQLATHMAGIPREAPLDYWQTLDFPPLETLLASLNGTELVYPAWSEYKYSNLGYAVLGYALAAIAAEPYEQYIAERILRPLGMDSSGFALTDDMRPRVAVGYATAGDQPPQPAPHPDLRAFTPAGQLYSSMADLARFIALQFHDGAPDPVGELTGATIGDATEQGAGGMDRHILKASTLREMRAPAFLSPDWQSAHCIAWALGRVADETVAGHSGVLFGYFADVAIVPRLKVGVALGANAELGSAAGLTQIVLEALLPVMSRVLEAQEANGQQGAQADWERYVGRYSMPGIMDVDVAVLDGHLVVIAPAGTAQSSAIQLVQEGPATFRAGGELIAGEPVVFESDAAGAITHVKAGSYRFERRHA